MTMQAIHTSAAGLVRPTSLGWSRRLVAHILLYVDAWIEARAMARAAQQKYPFADW
jgi:hypothetical protein